MWYNVYNERREPRTNGERKMKKQTKAERIFHDTYYSAINHIKVWGYVENDGYNSLFYNDDETVCTRTINAINKEIERKHREIELMRKYNAIDNEKYILYTQALNMVIATVKNELN